MNQELRILSFLFFSAVACNLFAQEITWSEDIAPLVYDKCSTCHHEGSAAHFSLMSYDDVASHASGIVYALSEGLMPPWPADPEYRSFMDQHAITPEERSNIVSWIEEGMNYGDTEQEPNPPDFGEEGSLLESIDFIAAIEPYEVQFNSEEYRWFVIPTDFEETKYIQAVEVKAGLQEAVHHADIHIDATGLSAEMDAEDPLPGFNSGIGWPTTTTYINAWQPGAGPARYPDNWGITLPPGADLVIEIHYAYGFAGEVDSTYMNIEFVDDPQNVRPISVGWLLSSGNMTNGPLVIPPNQISTFYQEANPFWSDKSLLAICPHMHLLGKSYKVWMETPQGDSIPLIDIPEWQFQWQFYYNFPSPQHFPAGSTLKSIGQYDNTSENPHNPNSPPQTVVNGALTTDEMFLCYFIYSDYEEGDENLILDPDQPLNVSWSEAKSNPAFSLYPNPTNDAILFKLPDQSLAPVRIFSSQGKLVYEGVHQPGIPLDVSLLAPGAYSLKVHSVTGLRGARFLKLSP